MPMQNVRVMLLNPMTRVTVYEPCALAMLMKTAADVLNVTLMTTSAAVMNSRPVRSAGMMGSVERVTTTVNVLAATREIAPNA